MGELENQGVPAEAIFYIDLEDLDILNVCNNGVDFEEYLWFQGKKLNLSNIGDTKTEKELRQLFEEFICFGSYPGVALIREIDVKRSYLKELIRTYIKKDIRGIGRIRNIFIFNNFLRILADQAGNLLNVDNLASSAGIARETVYDYLILLPKLSDSYKSGS